MTVIGLHSCFLPLLKHSPTQCDHYLYLIRHLQLHQGKEARKFPHSPAHVVSTGKLEWLLQQFFPADDFLWKSDTSKSPRTSMQVHTCWSASILSCCAPGSTLNFLRLADPGPNPGPNLCSSSQDSFSLHASTQHQTDSIYSMGHISLPHRISSEVRPSSLRWSNWVCCSFFTWYCSREWRPSTSDASGLKSTGGVKAGPASRVPFRDTFLVESCFLRSCCSCCCATDRGSSSGKWS